MPSPAGSSATGTPALWARCAIFAASAVAHAEDGEPAPTVDLDTPAGCVFIPTYTGVVWCMTLDAATAAVASL